MRGPVTQPGEGGNKAGGDPDPAACVWVNDHNHCWGKKLQRIVNNGRLKNKCRDRRDRDGK